jgi:hypothetical protein
MTMNSNFIATGHGYANKHGHLPANERTGNARIENLSAELSGDHPDRKRWLYVTGMQSAWQVQGSTAQARRSRSFYPQHLAQSDLTIVGQCSSQHEYDLLVQFVHRHHKTALGGHVMSGIEQSGGHEGAPIDFQIIPLLNTHTRRGTYNEDWTIKREEARSASRSGTPKVHVRGYITSIRAGASRFKFQPGFELTIKVTDDLLQDPTEASTISGVLFEEYLSRLRGPGGWVTTAQVEDAAPTGATGNAATWDQFVKSAGTFIDDTVDWTSNLFDDVIDFLPGVGE